MARVALLIGVSDYGPGFNWLPGVAKDLSAMQRILQHPEMGDFTEVTTLKNPEPLAMQAAIATLFKDKVSDRDDLVLLFFSGHCIKDHYNQLYFTTRRTCKNPQGELVKSTAVAASFVQEMMNLSCSKQQVVILDCCFSNAFADVLSPNNYDYVDIKNELGGEGRVILSATTSTQQSCSHKGFELSTYTQYLVEGIETGAADVESDRCISAYELHQYISRKAEEYSFLLEPTIYTVGDSYNIQLTKAPIQARQTKCDRDLTPSLVVADTQIDSSKISAYSSPNIFVSETAAYPNSISKSRHQNSQILTLSKLQPLIGAGLITLSVLAGIIYSVTRWQDLQHLSMGESIAADTNYNQQAATIFEHRNTVWSLAFSPDSQLLASSSGDKTIKLWQLKSGELLRAFPGAHSDTIWSIGISHDGQTLVSSSGDKTVKIWNLNTGELLRTLVGHTDTVSSVAISQDGQTVVSGSGDKTVKIWNLNTGKLLRTLVGHTDAVRSVAVNSDGKIVASGSADNTVKIWNLNTGKLLHTLTGHTGKIISIAISPNGKMVASGSNDKTIKLWNPQTGRRLHTLVGHSAHINSVAFRSDSKVLVSGAEDRLIKLWNPETGTLLHTLSRHSEDIYAVAISPDGKTLASGDKDGEIKLGH
ncbi:MAG TPA: hypothetical protein DEV81_18060 [Cyanobacteria bacterium UBA11049]|nr:hypothetical protein [Cyanobacteria bacterium UBA11049]